VPPVLEAQALFRRYNGAAPVDALSGVSLRLERGDFLAVTGPSGCGKSTLLHICGAMDRPSSGEVRLDGVPLHALSDDQLTAVRRDRVGFVFQFFNLLPTLTASENVGLPLVLAGQSARSAGDRANLWLERVGLAGRARHFPQQLSGGEMQRVALARALAHGPALLIADEPTGNLDSENGALVLRLLQDLNRETGVALLLATHAPDIAAAAGRVLRMRDGRIDGAL
jgi:putative ABC transport system ATP-binding protein